MDNDRINPGALLCLKYAGNRERIAGVSSEPVHRFSRKRHQSAASDYFRGLARRPHCPTRQGFWLKPRIAPFREKSRSFKFIIEVYDLARTVTIFLFDGRADPAALWQLDESQTDHEDSRKLTVVLLRVLDAAPRPWWSTWTDSTRRVHRRLISTPVVIGCRAGHIARLRILPIDSPAGLPSVRFARQIEY